MTVRWSRRQFLGRSAALAVAAVGVGPLLAACGGDDDDGSGSSSGGGGGADALAGTPENPVTLPIFDDNPAIADGLAPETGTLKIFNYPDYIDEEVIAAFEEEYGVTVEVTTFDVDDEAVEKLRSGQVKTDLFLSASYNNLPKLVAGKLAQPMNRSYITQLRLDPAQLPGPVLRQGLAVLGALHRVRHRDHVPRRPGRPCRGRGEGLGDLLGPGLLGPHVDPRRQARGHRPGAAAQGHHRHEHHRSRAHRAGRQRPEAADRRVEHPGDDRGLQGRARGRDRHRPRLVGRPGQRRQQLPARGHRCQRRRVVVPEGQGRAW